MLLALCYVCMIPFPFWYICTSVSAAYAEKNIGLRACSVPSMSPLVLLCE